MRLRVVVYAPLLALLGITGCFGQQSWGLNSSGQLGNPLNSGSSINFDTTPVSITGITDIALLAAGTSHTLALKTDGTVWSWGLNRYGALGRPLNSGNTTATPAPAQISSLGTFKSISAGYHSLAVATDGTVWAWGHNQYGQLGNSTNNGTLPVVANSTPTQVSGLTNVVAVAAGWYHSLALKNDGTVWAWGYNQYGQIGNDTNSGSATANPNPTQVLGLPTIVAISGGEFHSLALDSQGNVWAWGWNRYGQLGTAANDLSDVPTTAPVQIIGLSNVTAISAGGYHSLALTSTGAMFGWGYNSNGQLGNTTNNNSSNPNPTPAQITAVSGVTAIAAGEFHSVAVENDGSVWTFGANRNGQLGNGTSVFTANPTPGKVSGVTGAIAVAASMGDSFVLSSSTVAVTIASGISGSSFSVTGAGCQPGSYPAPQVLQWLPGSVCSVTFTSPQSGSVGTQYVFTGWADGPVTNPRSIGAPNSATTYTAQFQTQYQLTVAANPIAGGTATGAGYYAANAAAPVSATANAGYVFTGWSGTVASTSSPSTTVQMTGPLTVSANFVAAVPVTIASSTAGLSFSVTGAGCQPGSYITSQVLSWAPGSSCVVGFTSPQGSAGTQYVFTGWDDSSTANPRTLSVPASATTYTANFQTQYQLTVVANPPSAGSVTGSGYYNAGTNASISASANNGFGFLNWTGPVASGSSAGTTVLMSGPLTVTANYTGVTTIASSPSGLSFSISGVAGCQPGTYSTPLATTWAPGSLCTVSFASPMAGGPGTQYSFSAWADGPATASRTFTASSQASTFTANFQKQYLLTTSNATGGSITAGGYFKEGTGVSVSASANAGYQFLGFSGDLSGQTSPQTVTMNAPHSVSASFVLTTSVTVGPAAGQYSDSVNLTATVLPVNQAVSGTLQFSVGGVLVGSLPLNATGTYSLPYAIAQKQGSYAIAVTFSSSNSGVSSSSGTNSLVVSLENATVTPSPVNPAVVLVGPGGTAAVTLSASLQEAADGSLGDITRANPLTFTLTPVVGGSPLSCVSATVSCTFPNVPVNAYDVTLTIGGDYYSGAGKSTLAVVDPTDAVSANFRILHNGVEATVSAHPKYTSNGGLQGDFGYSEPGVSVDATALLALSVVGDTAVLDALVSVNGASGYKARVVFTSNGGSGKNDQFSLQVTDGNGNIVPGLTFGPVGLTRGNMQVH